MIDSLLKMFATMFSLDMFHSDLKPENVVLKKASGQAVGEWLFELRLIDFGSVSLQYSLITQYTELYAVPDLQKRLPFKSKQERVKSENYTIGRTIMHIMLLSACASEGSNPEELFNSQDPASIEKQFEKLSHFYDESIVQIVRMLIDEEDPEKIT